MSRHQVPEPADVADRVTEQIVRHVRDLRLPKLEDAAVAATYRILADPDIAAGLRALPVLAAISDMHQPRPWGGASSGSAVTVCIRCNEHFPCEQRRVLDGDQAQAVAS